MTDASPSYRAILSRNISAARGRLQLSQAAVAQRMRSLGFDWHQQTAGAIEKGKRRVTAEEIHGLAWALQTSISALMRPGDEELVVELPSGATISAASVQRSAGRGVWDRAIWWRDNTVAAIHQIGPRWDPDKPMWARSPEELA